MLLGLTASAKVRADPVRERLLQRACCRRPARALGRELWPSFEVLLANEVSCPTPQASPSGSWYGTTPTQGVHAGSVPCSFSLRTPLGRVELLLCPRLPGRGQAS